MCVRNSFRRATGRIACAAEEKRREWNMSVYMHEAWATHEIITSLHMDHVNGPHISGGPQSHRTAPGIAGRGLLGFHTSPPSQGNVHAAGRKQTPSAGRRTRPILPLVSCRCWGYQRPGIGGGQPSQVGRGGRKCSTRVEIFRRRRPFKEMSAKDQIDTIDRWGR